MFGRKRDFAGNVEGRAPEAPYYNGSPVGVLEKTRMPSAPKAILPAIDTNLMSAAHIAEYRKTCEEIGLDPTDILVEEFRAFLASKDIPTFNLAEVVSYMDAVAAKDNPAQLGWHWCPVRDKDAEAPLTFGRPSTARDRHSEPTVASDFYQSHKFREMREWRSMGMYHPVDFRDHRSPHYTRTLPLHALKKIALIEREFHAGKPVFLVTDYTTQPHIVVNPDPFLMAVIPNSAVSHGKGRFVIDVWDEPGFGIELMLK